MFFHALRPKDVHLRRFGSQREFTPAQLARFTQIDFARAMAFILTRPMSGGEGETLGVARVVIDPDNTSGEFAIVVRSDLQGQGLGMLPMKPLIGHARSRALESMVGVAFAGNTGTHALARRFGFAMGPGGASMAELRLALNPPSGA